MFENWLCNYIFSKDSMQAALTQSKLSQSLLPRRKITITIYFEWYYSYIWQKTGWGQCCINATKSLPGKEAAGVCR